MRKKLLILLLLLTFSLSSVSIVKADELFNRTAYDLLQGGWTQRVLGTGGKHWTSYQLNSYPNVRTVIATIKVLGNGVETKSGPENYAKVTSVHYVGPYDQHIHSYIVP